MHLLERKNALEKELADARALQERASLALQQANIRLIELAAQVRLIAEILDE